MLIRNFRDLATSSRKKESLQVLEAGLRAADPAAIVPRYVTRGEIRMGGGAVRLSKYSAVYTVAFGKAADAMTRAFDAAAPVKAGIIVIPRGSRSVVTGRKFRIFNAGHPRPDRASVRAAKESLKFVRNRRDGELVVFLASGGGSSLLALPDGVTLEDKMHATDLLLRSGASIREFNCVRRHVSGIKGGRLAEGMRCDGVALVMSDVEGDDPSVVASGPACRDETTHADALAVMKKYGLTGRAPEVARALREGARRGGGPREGVECEVIATNAVCLEAMLRAARRGGREAESMQVFGDVKEAARSILGRLPGPGGCLVFGGETTVRVLGRGAGGRNQEMVLRLLKNTQGAGRLVIASMGTDGIDGNTPYAGAITENFKADAGEIKRHLRESDSGGYLRRAGATIVTGPTHTNLMDIGLVMA